MDRRTFVRAATTTAGAIVISGIADAPWATAATNTKRVYVLVLDGCRPDEITPELTPRLHHLRSSARWYPTARSVPIAETLPNHTAMLTGVLPSRNGVPANQIWDTGAKAVRTVQKPSDLAVATILKRLRDNGTTTGSVLSKKYLYSLFNSQATYQWEPEPLLPVTGHALDAFTAEAFKAMVTKANPAFVIASFGDIDRFGHADLSGSSVRALRHVALRNTDTLVGELVAFLKKRGLWKTALVMVLADHGMDWSVPDHLVSLKREFATHPKLASRFAFADNGGAELLTYTGPAGDRAAVLAEAVGVASGVEGVLSVASTTSLSLGTKAGDLVAYCRAGWRFSDPDLISNPIPGNHGHPATHAIPFFLTGGMVTAATSTARASTLDVAPTVAKVFALPAPTGGWDGTARW